MAHSMTISLPLAAQWPSAAELALRQVLQDKCDEALAGDGFVEGGGAGQGVMDIFIAGVLEIERAIDRINLILEEHGLLASATIRVANDADDAN